MNIRTIGYRIWSYQEDKMYWGIIPISENVIIDPKKEAEIRGHFSPPMQFTGMFETMRFLKGFRRKLDKNGIFEADIIRLYEPSKIYNKNVPTDMYGIVKYNEDCAKYMFKCVDGHNYDFQFINVKYNMSIEGNIWENLDILKKLDSNKVGDGFKKIMSQLTVADRAPKKGEK